MAEIIRVRGTEGELSAEDSERDAELAFDGGIEVDVKHVIDVSPAARDRGDEQALDLDDDDVVEYRTADGWVDFTTVKAVRSAGGQGRGTADGIDLLSALETGASTRGGRGVSEVKTYAVKIPTDIRQQLDILDELGKKAIDLAADPVARLAAKKVVSWVERPVPDARVGEPKTDGKPKQAGVYRIDDKLEVRPSNRLATTDAIPDGRSLVLVHGTFSSTEGAFRALRQTDEWERLLHEYDGQVFSLEHKTLSVNPVQNALDLARHLPDRARIDLVTHSRGGLVGDYLSLAAAGDLDPARHYRKNREIRDEEKDLLAALRNALSNSDVNVERFVRVASPARGTILASPRLDEFAGFLFNVVDKIPGGAGWMFTVAKSLILSFLNQRTKPAVIPGLEAMMPQSPFIRLLNSSGSTLDDGLAVVAGDVDKSRWFKWFVEKGADLFYGEEHDYVVDTLSMYQGAMRPKSWVSLHAGPDVNHFTYFSEHDSRRRVERWLTQKPENTEFKPLDRTAPELKKAAKRHRGSEDGAMVLIVPDLMGTALKDPDQSLVWPDPARIVADQVGSIGVSASLAPGELLEGTYSSLVEHLSAEFKVNTFPYDWRNSLDDAAHKLVAAITSESPGKPIHVVAHGAGGLVVRRAMNLSTEVQQRIGRVLLLGCPNDGMHSALEMVTGIGSLTEKLMLLDPRKSSAAIGRTFRSYDSVLETLPAAGEHRDPATWSALNISWAGAAEKLAATAALVKERWPDDSAPIAIAGVGYLTAARAAMAGTRFELSGTFDGDGVVTSSSATAGIDSHYYVTAPHGDLPSHPESVAGYADLLRTGRTHRLQRTHADVAQQDQPIAPQTDHHLFPTALDLERAALGGGIPRAQAAESLLQIEVVHGNLRFAEHSVMVGHYMGSTLAGAERALDRHLDGRLSRRDLLGFYEGHVGSAEVVMGDPDDRPPGGVVIGMGELGNISATKITTGVAEGAVRVALAELERPRPDREGTDEPLRVGIASVLIGTSGPSGLSIDDAIAAIARGIVDANRLLAGQPLSRNVRIGRLQLIELYEDVAVEAMHAVHRMTGRGTVNLFGAEPVSSAPYLRAVEGGRAGQPPPEYNRGEWRPIMVESTSHCEEDPCAECDAKLAVYEAQLGIEGDEPSPEQHKKKARRDLTFTSVGLAARSEQMVHAWQRQLLDKVIGEVVEVPNPDRQLYNTLYELLLPNYLKGTTSEVDNLLLILDSEATRYPWEMLAPRTSSGEIEPLSVRSGMIRRLLTPAFREVRRSVGNKALVIGDPPSGSSEYPRLPGARSEAKAVASLLASQEFSVTSLISDSEDNQELNVLNGLFADEYRIIHIAAHGVYDDDPEKSGVIIGDGSVLSPLTLGQMPSIPPLVFLNCCHLGTIDKRYHEFAASVSEQLIRDGVRAVVAAGWAVDDGAAEQFAKTFYALMLEGHPFGDAVHRARRAIYDDEAFTGLNTWGAYQCYGDPGFKLVGRRPSSPQDAHVAPTELVRWLDSMAGWAAEEPSGSLGAMASQVEKMLANSPQEWLGSQVQYAAGRALGDMGDFDKAIDRYNKALDDNAALAPIRLLEQLANLAGRRAVEIADPDSSRTDHAAPSDAEARIDELLNVAQSRLDQLQSLTGGVERHRLLAAHHKRLAHVYHADRDSLRKHLEKAHGYYRQGQEAARTDVDLDTTTNALLTQVLLRLVDGTRAKNAALAQAIDDTKQEAERRVNSQPDFWHRVAVPDITLVKGLSNQDLNVELISAQYQEAFTKRSTARERRSVIDHVRFITVVLQELSADKSDQSKIKKLSVACDQIHAGLSE